MRAGGEPRGRRVVDCLNHRPGAGGGHTHAARIEAHAVTRPFEQLRVVDLSDRLSGAFAARLFADFGADVVLAEPPTGHPLRHEPPFLFDASMSSIAGNKVPMAKAGATVLVECEV